MARLIPSKVFMKDAVNAWGKEKTMGLAEQASRIGGVMSYDQRGDLLWQDDAESPTVRYGTGGTGSVARSNDTARCGSFCYKLVTGATANDDIYMNWYLTDFHDNTKIGVECSFASASVKMYIDFIFWYFDSSGNQYTPAVRFDTAAKTASVLIPGGAWQTIGTSIGYYNSVYNWATMKLVFDISTMKYVRALVFGEELDASAYSIYKPNAFAFSRSLWPLVSVTTTENVAKTVYADNIIVTENEPE